MAKYLVIVESPAKVKTVKKYLGANYEVAASMGHVRDLPKARLCVDVKNGAFPWCWLMMAGATSIGSRSKALFPIR